jgi:excinuclease UvrABC ATPase subunit
MTQEPTESLFGCETCSGTKKIKTTLESGQEISIPCPKCSKETKGESNANNT